MSTEEPTTDASGTEARLASEALLLQSMIDRVAVAGACTTVEQAEHVQRIRLLVGWSLSFADRAEA